MLDCHATFLMWHLTDCFAAVVPKHCSSGFPVIWILIASVKEGSKTCLNLSVKHNNAFEFKLTCKMSGLECKFANNWNINNSFNKAKKERTDERRKKGREKGKENNGIRSSNKKKERINWKETTKNSQFFLKEIQKGKTFIKSRVLLSTRIFSLRTPTVSILSNKDKVKITDCFLLNNLIWQFIW